MRAIREARAYGVLHAPTEPGTNTRETLENKPFDGDIQSFPVFPNPPDIARTNAEFLGNLGMAVLRRYAPLKTLTPLRRAGRLRPFSKKRRKLLPARAECRREVLERDKTCQFPGCHEPAVHVHEKRLRSQGGDWLNPDGAIGICAEHHDWIHRNRDAARTLSLIQDGKAATGGES
jgi:hypothetical protein